MAPFVQDSSLPPSPEPLDAVLSVPSAKTLLAAPLDPLDSVENLSDLLVRASRTNGGLVFYSEEDGHLEPTALSYRELLAEASDKARLISHRMGPPSPEQVLLLHFDTQRDNVLWFWAATMAGYLPTVSLPLVNDTAQRRRHLMHLHGLLEEPVILTTKRLAPEFLGLEQLRLSHIEALQATEANDDTEIVCGRVTRHQPKRAGDVAALMLTSGSTGNVKAVPLRHGQILHALRGKSAHHGTTRRDVFLNWVGLDHVASLTEIHLHAMSLGADQVHVPASALLREPLRFVRLLDSHQVCYTFAPNFFLTMVRDALVAEPTFTANVSSLRALISGGESNPTATCLELTREFRRLGGVGEMIRPGFGMTETCAGSIYSLSCPSYDLERHVDFASLGSCIPGMEMRVLSLREPGVLAARGEAGELQVSGPVVFTGYLNDEQATRDAFTDDGWFRTGDLAWVDDAGSLHLAGRTKDTIIVNGVKWSATELEVAIEEEGIAGVVPSFTVAFPTRAPGSPTESIAIVYSPRYAPDDHHARSESAQAIAKVVSLVTGRKPARLIPLPLSRLEKSSLGKISRTKIRAALEAGHYDEAEREDQRLLNEHRRQKWRGAQTATERIVQATLAKLLEMRQDSVEMDTEASIFDLGIDSFHLIRLKVMVEKAMGAAIDIPMSVMMTEPTVAAIASAIDRLLSQPTAAYTPVVPLQPHGSGTPLFCIHPGSGDILVFIALASHFTARPVYALRSRGYNPQERFFRSIEETVETYVSHIREVQPEGPYAIAGYSLGSSLAFEVGKALEAQGQEVRFLASIDYPPHLAHYVRGLDWIDVLLHIAFFLELIDEETMKEITPHLHTLDRDAALSHVLAIGDASRAAALAMYKDRLRLISDIAENFRVNVETYEPVGKVQRLDVFVADPPTYAARDRRDWRDNKLGRWVDFSETEVQFHDCPGIHAKMLNREHMADFAKIFKAAMRRRGV